MKKRILAILSCVLILFSAVGFGALSAAAASGGSPWDVGNYNDYGGGDYGGGNYGGGDYGGGGYDGGGYSYDGGSSGSFFFTDNPIAAVIVVVIVIIIMAVFGEKSRRSGKSSRSQGNAPVPMDFTQQISNAIRQIDPNFSSDTFITWSKDVFITLQQAWTARDWSAIRPLEKEELFEQHKRQLDEYINNHKINIIERINVGQTHLHKYERDAQYEYLTVYMATRMVDYIIDENTRAVLKGDPNTDCYMNYLLTFMRKTGVKSREGNDKSVSKSCPNCGAPLSITSSGKCDYCGSIITTGDFDWVLAKMDAVKPNTVIDNRGVIINNGSNTNGGANNSSGGANPNNTAGNNSNGGQGGVSFDDMMNGSSENDNNNNNNGNN